MDCPRFFTPRSLATRAFMGLVIPRVFFFVMAVVNGFLGGSPHSMLAGNQQLGCSTSNDVICQSLENSAKVEKEDLHCRLFKLLSPSFAKAACNEFITGCHFAGPVYSADFNDNLAQLKPWTSGACVVFVIPAAPEVNLANNVPRIDLANILSNGNKVWMDFNKFARARLTDDHGWRRVDSDASLFDGLYIQQADALPATQLIGQELEAEIFDDPYWSYYADVDLWGVVLDINDPRIGRSANIAANLQELNQASTQDIAKTTTPDKISGKAKRKKIGASPASFRKSSSKIATRNRDSTNSYSTTTSLIRSLKNRVWHKFESLKVNTQNVILEVQQHLEQTRLKPALDQFRFNSAHRELMATEQLYRLAEMMKPFAGHATNEVKGGSTTIAISKESLGWPATKLAIRNANALVHSIQKRIRSAVTNLKTAVHTHCEMITGCYR